MVRIIGSLMSIIASIVAAIIPWIVRTLNLIVRLLGVAVASIWVGIPTAVDRISTEWTSEAVQLGAPHEHEHFIYTVTAVLAGGLIIVSWIVFAAVAFFPTRLDFVGGVS